MTRTLNVYALPSLVTEEELADGLVVVIDVLRATTTIVTALAAGAREVIPRGTVEEALAEAAKLDRQYTLLGGERNALPIEGFDLGNSPAEYTPERVADRSIVFTTTNGTRAMAKCGLARRVLAGAFVNASAVLRRIAESAPDKIHLLCAGTDGYMSNDDVLFAGMLVASLEQRGDTIRGLNAQAITAAETWRYSFALPISLGGESMPPELLATKLETSLGGKALVEAGLAGDILDAARLDRYDVVPELDTRTGRIFAVK